MEVFKFRAKSLQAALEAVREQLGPDAEVLDTKEVKTNRLGIFASSLVEVAASAAEQTQAPATITSASEQNTPPDEFIDACPPAENDYDDEPQGSPHTTFQRSADDHHRIDDIAREVAYRLTIAGIPSSRAQEIVQLTKDHIGPYLPNIAEFEAEVNSTLAQQLQVGGAIQPVEGKQQVCAFIGTSGVGKTNCLSQVAAGLRFEYGCRIGLITLDTFKLGGVDQMLQFAEFVSAPIEVVNAPDRMPGAIERLKECDVILIDTTALSIRGLEHDPTKNYFAAANVDKTYLVLNATTHAGLAKRSIVAAQQVGATNVALTHLDEAEAFGSWYSLLRECDLPVSYLGIGQQIPSDLVIAHPRRLARELQRIEHV